MVVIRLSELKLLAEKTLFVLVCQTVILLLNKWIHYRKIRYLFAFEGLSSTNFIGEGLPKILSTLFLFYSVCFSMLLVWRVHSLENVGFFVGVTTGVIIGVESLSTTSDSYSSFSDILLFSRHLGIVNSCLV